MSADSVVVSPLVFVSHSGYEGETEVALDALVEALRAGGYTPLLDSEVVVPGTDFTTMSA